MPWWAAIGMFVVVALWAVAKRLERANIEKEKNRWRYPDGSFQPDKPVTRAELAAVLRRLEDGNTLYFDDMK